MRRAYGVRRPIERDRSGVAGPLASATVVSVAVGGGWSPWLGGAFATCVAILVARWSGRAVAALLIGLAIVGAVRADSARAGLAPRAVGPYTGWMLLVDDPQPFGAVTRVVAEIDDQRFELWERGRAAQIRVGTWRAGERVFVSGTRQSLDDERLARVAWQHVVGELRVDWSSDVADGAPVARASNRVRQLIEGGAASLPGDDGALFRGLVIGDDRDQPWAMIERFRASGLSHLTAVSGQNVSFVLAAAGPLLVRLRPWWRWAATLGLVAWFVGLTRFEPSIVRAGVMAGLSATAFVLGRDRTPFVLLCWAVTGLLLVDPLLSGSVGFWLSVGATGGVCTVGPFLARRLERLGPLALPFGVTVGAQVGVVVPAMLVFGRLPLVSIPANLLAVPVAGFVMLYGLPAGLIAGVVPPVATVVMFPCRLGVRWVDQVAVLAARIEPGGSATLIGWVVFAAVVVVATCHPAAMNRSRHGSPSADR